MGNSLAANTEHMQAQMGKSPIANKWSETSQGSEPLPCRSAEVNLFSVFLCQRCREIRREILGEIFSATFSRVWVCEGKFPHMAQGLKKSIAAFGIENFERSIVDWNFP